MNYLDIIRKNKFFENVNEDNLDLLSGTLRRESILGYIQYMMDNKKPFYLGIADIDNLKKMNDLHGHLFGDFCIKSIGDTLKVYLGENGLVGRYGGDEFLFIYENVSANTPKDLLADLYGGKTIFRRYIEQADIKFYVTGTIGLTRYPHDATTFIELFEKTDKALYRGKQKGRNCYIIYDDEKHKDIDVNMLKRVSIDIIMDELTDMLIADKPFNEKILNVLRYSKMSLQIGGAVYLDKNLNYLFDDMNAPIKSTKLTIEEIDSFFKENSLIEYVRSSDMAVQSPVLYDFFMQKHILTILIKKIVIDGVDYGYLGLYENQVTRVWQDYEKIVLSFLQKIIGLITHYKNNK